jgi:asparagine synthase (glutamine-hydrolysing)
LFAAIFNNDCRPVDFDRIGLGAEDVRILGGARQVALLRSREASSMRDIETCRIQSLDDRWWIVGRLRLDASRDLATALGQPGSDDGLLCLHAYVKWGDDFLDHLAGDFCFVLWDEARGRLIAARDQLGIRSLFHAASDGAQVICDSLEWIASWKALAGELDDLWIVDFLTFGHTQDFDRTVYREIRRLPPAHLMSLSAAGANVRRYWRLKIDEPLYFGDKRLYGERFRELTLRAVADRMPVGRVGVSMSGGIDSTTLAASAVEVAQDRARVIARCVHYESLIPDDEARFAALAANHLGIELRLASIDNDRYDPQWRARGYATVEPWANVFRGRAERTANQAMAEQAPVWFMGEGPDNALWFDRDAYLSWLMERRQWRRLAEALWLYVGAKGLRGWGSTVGRYVGPRLPAPTEPELPVWLNPDLAARMSLEERWTALGQGGPGPRHPWHPRSMASFEDPVWQSIFADCEDDEAQAPYVWRHPFLDLRVLQFMLSLPPVPWARRKLVMRQAMRGRLPAAILARDKTPIVHDPMARALRHQRLPELLAPRRLGRWVDVERLVGADMDGRKMEQVLAAYALDYWLAMGRR